MGRINGCKVHSWIVFFLWLLNSFGVKSHPVDITIVESAVAKGAVCLDGGPPAYHFSPGFGAGVNNWFVTLEGGGWCNNVTTCLLKRDTRLGSSKKMATPLMFSGILGKSQKSNPDFFDWNKVKVRYCDGSSFTGDVEAVDPKTNLHYRGARIFQAIMDELLAKGMSHAEKAILAGCSAGGLASILHCDKFRSLLPSSAYVKCLSDAGYFINAHDISGAPLIQQIYNDVVNTHQSAKNLPSSCTTKMNAGLCFFPENVAAQIQTPLFLLNAAYDSWQIKNILAPGVADPHGTWSACKSDIRKCSPSQIQAMQAYRESFLNALARGGTSSSRGFFINSCYAHCQSEVQETFMQPDSPVLDSTSIATAFGDWYFDRKPFQKIDCPYPCDKTCHNRIFNGGNDGDGGGSGGA